MLLLALGYTYRFELRDVADRVLAELVPGRAASRGRTVEIAAAAGGSFSVTTQVNGARVSMVLDTGASAVVLTQEAAKAAGLPLEVLNYSVQRRHRERPHPRGAGHARPDIGRRHHRTLGAGADRAARTTADEPARHDASSTGSKAGRCAATSCCCAASRDPHSGSLSEAQRPTRPAGNSRIRSRAGASTTLREPRAIGRGDSSTTGAISAKPMQRHEADRERRQQRLMRQPGEHDSRSCPQS